MKKILSLAFAAVMLFTMTSGIGINALAAETEENKVAFEIINAPKTMTCDDSKKLLIKVTSGKVETKEYKSSNTKVIDIWDDGYMYVTGLGKAKITVTVNKKYSKTVNITVNKTYGFVFKDSARKYPKINGKEYKNWKSSNSKNIKANKTTFKGKKSDSKATLTKKVGKTTYKVKVYCLSKKAMKEKLIAQAKKDVSKFPKCKNAETVKVSMVYYTIDYAKNGVDAVVRGYNKKGKKLFENYYIYQYAKDRFYCYSGWYGIMK